MIFTSLLFFQIFHSDYMSGWEEKELQDVLDNCENHSDAASPDAFCSDFLTFRGKPKQEGEQVQDDDIKSDLEKIQPNMVDIKETISPEDVSGIPELLRGACTGTLIRDNMASTSAVNIDASSKVPTTTATDDTITTILIILVLLLLMKLQVVKYKERKFLSPPLSL